MKAFSLISLLILVILAFPLYSSGYDDSEFFIEVTHINIKYDQDSSENVTNVGIEAIFVGFNNGTETITVGYRNTGLYTVSVDIFDESGQRPSGFRSDNEANFGVGFAFTYHDYPPGQTNNTWWYAFIFEGLIEKIPDYTLWVYASMPHDYDGEEFNFYGAVFQIVEGKPMKIGRITPEEFSERFAVPESNSSSTQDYQFTNSTKEIEESGILDLPLRLINLFSVLILISLRRLRNRK